MTQIKLDVHAEDEIIRDSMTSANRRDRLGEARDGRRRADPYYAAKWLYGSFTRLRRSALVTTETDDKLIAAAAMIGLSSQPNAG